MINYFVFLEDKGAKPYKDNIEYIMPFGIQRPQILIVVSAID